MTTRTDLFRRVLEDLRVTAVGEASPPEYVQLVSERYDSLYSTMVDQGIVSWGLNDEIPEDATLAATAALAFFCAVPFNKPANAQVGAIALPAALGGPSWAERQLRKLVTNAYVYTRARPEYF
jgi:hypothetical protein